MPHPSCVLDGYTLTRAVPGGRGRFGTPRKLWGGNLRRSGAFGVGRGSNSMIPISPLGARCWFRLGSVGRPIGVETGGAGRLSFRSTT